MQRLFSLVGSVGTPIALAALTILVLYGVFKLLLENKLLSELRSTESAKVVRSVVNWVGFSAVMTILLALVPAAVKQITGSRTKEISQLYSSMVFDLTNHEYGDADVIADQILQIDPENIRALSAKGMIRFYAEDFHEAASYFRKALKGDPSNRIMRKNLADALVETGGLAEAIAMYERLDDGQPDAALALGRAYLCAGRYQDALGRLEQVPSGLERAHARVLEAAALAAQANEPGGADEELVRAKGKLQLAMNAYPEYWTGVLSGKERDIHQTFVCAIQHLRPLIPNTVVAMQKVPIGEDDSVELRDHH